MKVEKMEDLMQAIDHRLQLIGSIIGSCCVWKRTEFCLTERRLPNCYMHNHSYCDAVKRQCGLKECQRNDTDLIIRHLRSNGNKPFLHQCHAGACELVIPVYRTGRVLGCVLCGPFSMPGREEPLLTPWRESLKNTLPELVNLLMADLLERFYNRYPEYTKMDGRIVKSLNFIAANYSKHITLKAAAEAAALSPSRFSHLFKSSCGIDFTGYLLNLRLSVACDMLKQTNISIGEIALFCGFASQQHFTTAFKKIFNTPPSPYRVAKN